MAITRIWPIGAPVAAPAQAVVTVNFGWFAPFEQPLSRPSRFDDQPTSGWLQAPTAAPQGWFQPFDQPRPARAGQHQSDFFVPEPAAALASISGMAWYQPFDLPARKAAFIDANAIWVPFLPAVTPAPSPLEDTGRYLTKEQLEALRRRLKSKRRDNDWSREIEDRRSVRNTLEAFFGVADKEELEAVVAEMPVVEAPKAALSPSAEPFEPAPFIPQIDWRALEASRQAMDKVVAVIQRYVDHVEAQRQAEAARKAFEEADEADVELLLLSM